MKTRLWYIVALAATFIGGWWLGQYVSRPEIVERVRIDTVFYERPQPFSTSDITVSVNVPKLVFARNPVMLHADSGNVASNIASNVASFTNQGTNQATTQIAETVTNCNGLEPSIKNYLNIDSVQMEIAVRTLEYRDSTYYARVVGPVVGTLGPRLDYFETYNKTITRTVTKRPHWAVTVGGGVSWTPAGIQPTVGAQIGFVLWSR